MSLQFNRTRRFFAALMVVAVPLAIGCGSIGKKRDTDSDFLKPLASATPDVAKTKRQPMPSERSLCMQTAKTVASKGHAVEAVKLYEHVEQLDPAGEPLDAELAPLYADLGNHDAAIQRYKRIVQRSPDDSDLSNNFAWTLMESGRFDQAIAEATRGLQNDAGNRRLQSTLAMIHYRKGDSAAALRHFSEALGESAAHHNLAVLEIDAGNVDSARAHLQQAMQSAPPDAQTETLLAALDTAASAR
ncbi:outer membrane protein PgaA [Rosistilla ulvae]|uniref:Outer membrane protein PgaA n=1 Tax=Rosistilla ulvae TaxID=1930277 RepID=A0A517M2M0_9BACT|nr:tetratricopeptide repeat protein [Rosistilla ulvae]QDS89118.1 outer membrane protein PgaA [Rosistilla ulvae]